MDVVREWASENHVEIEKRYYGGPVTADHAVAGDSVKQCFNYLQVLLSAESMAKALPEGDDEGEFQRRGYVLSQ